MTRPSAMETLDRRSRCADVARSLSLLRTAVATMCAPSLRSIAWLGLVALLGGCAGLARQGQEGEAAAAPPVVDRGPFPYVGERIEYAVRHANVEMDLLIASAEVGAEVQASDGTSCIPIIGEAESVALARMFVRLSDRTYTCIDPRSWEPYYAFKDLDENEKQRTYHVFYWPLARSVSIERVADGRSHTRESPTPAHTVDAISWVYLVRSMPQEEGAVSTWYIEDGWILSQLTLVAQAEEEVWTPVGIYKTMRYDLYREKFESKWPQGALAGVYVDPVLSVDTAKYFMGNVWISQDELRIPVRLAIETKLGDIELSLRGYEPPSGLPPIATEAPTASD